MGRYVFKLPDVGEGTAEAEIVKWHGKVGDEISEEQPLVDIMTDKATVEIVSPVKGRIVSRKGEEGAKAAVGSELVVFEVEGGELDRPERPPPLVRPGRFAALASDHPRKGEEDKLRTQGEDGKTGAKGLASPAVRARARALGIDLATVAASGTVVQHGDLDKILLSRQAAPSAGPAMAPGEEGSEDIKIFGLRRRIAERMLEAKRRIPHFAYVEEVDVTELEALRGKLNETHASRGKLTMLPFLIRALIKAVTAHPGVNAHFNDAEGVVRRFNAVHVGIATQTERGLLVPVIRNAQTKDIWKLAAEIARLSEAARAGKSHREELSGSTITVTSLGALGGVAATPIINPPEVAIVGVNRMAERPMVRDGAVVIRKMMNLSSSFDHRIVDGYEAATFIKAVKDCLEDPAGLVAAPAA